MKTQRLLLTAITLCLLIFTSCSNNDDNNDGNNKTTKELLISGKWYQESSSKNTYTACNKKGYIQFMDNGDLIINSFEDNSGSCESVGAVTAKYTLNDKTITITFGSDTSSATINSITESKLTVTTQDDDKQVFDKTEG